MTVQHEFYGSAPSALRAPAHLLSRIGRECALHDWFVLTYLILLNVAALSAPPSAARTAALLNVFGLLAALVVTLVLVRGAVIRDKFWAPLLYRLGIYGSVQISYFMLAGLLPVVNTTTVDLELYRLDVALFGFEPAIALDAFVNPISTEWFAFFYFGYFILLALHVISILFFSSRTRVLGEFAAGMLFVFCVGHILYMLVPGFGPYKAMASHFEHAFPSGAWLDMVMLTVASGGAQMDIFPSLHTAAPAFIALYSFRHRDKAPFQLTWPVVAFCSVNIMVATMFLRWHYVIDVVAGVALASAAVVVASYATRREAARRGALLTESWPMFFRKAARLAPSRSWRPHADDVASSSRHAA